MGAVLNVDGEEDSELEGKTGDWRGVIRSPVGLRVSSCVCERGRLFAEGKAQVPNDFVWRWLLDRLGDIRSNIGEFDELLGFDTRSEFG